MIRQYNKKIVLEDGAEFYGCGYDVPASVHLDGGTLKIQIASDNTVTMTGPAETVYEGEIALC